MWKQGKKGAVFRLLFCFGFYVSLCTNPVSSSSCGKPKNISRQSLGRIAEFGTIFDETTDDFSLVNLFKESIGDKEANIIQAMQSNQTNVTNTTNTNASLTKIFQQIGIDYNTAMDILLGHKKLNGSAGFLDNLKSNSNEVTGVLLYTFRTVDENLQIFSKSIKTLLVEDALHHRGTHVVTGITWGGRIAVQLRKTVTNGESLDEVNKLLEKELEVLKNALKSSQMSSSQQQKSNFTIEIFADASLPHPPLTTHKEAIDWFKNISEMVQNVNNGKGTPIRYHLTPLTLIRNHLNFESEYETDVCEVDEFVSKNILNIFDELFNLELKINSLLLQAKNCLSRDTIKKINQTKSEILISKAKYKITVKESWICAKSGTCSSSTYSDLQHYNFGHLNTKVGRFDNALERIKICTMFQNAKAKPKTLYFGPGNEFQRTIADNSTEQVYVLFFKYQWIEANKSEWNEILNTSKTIIKSPRKLFVVDCDFDYLECKSINHTVVKQIRNGIISNVNVVVKPVASSSVIKGKLADSFRLVNGTQIWDRWYNNTNLIFISYYIINTTNPDEVVGGRKPILEEFGPYIYEEKRLKVDIKMNDKNGTVYYRQRITYFFRPDLSNGTEDDQFNIINFPLVVLTAMGAKLNLIGQMLIESVISAHEEETLFRKVTVAQLLFKGRYVPMMKTFEESTGKSVFHNYTFGLFYPKNGSDEGILELKTGAEDSSEFGKVISWNGKTKLNFWDGDACNMINGSDGSMFPPFVERNQIVHLFSAELCRPLSLKYTEDVKYKNITGYQFAVDKELFEDPRINLDNACFCKNPGLNMNECLKAGVIELSACREGAPIVMSNPHFLDGSEEYLSQSIGLKPDRSRHRTYIELEPNTGLLLQSHKRIQVNIALRKNTISDHFDHLPEMIYPILWSDEYTSMSDASAAWVQSLISTS